MAARTDPVEREVWLTRYMHEEDLAYLAARYAGFTLTEMAGVAGISPSRVQQRLREALARVDWLLTAPRQCAPPYEHSPHYHPSQEHVQLDRARRARVVAGLRKLVGMPAPARRPRTSKVEAWWQWVKASAEMGPKGAGPR